MNELPEPSFEVHSGREIRDLEDWLRLAGPKKGEAQWRKGRSAYECGRAWLGDTGPAVPTEIQRLLDSRGETRGFVPLLAVPELVTRLDESPREHRNHDLIVQGECSGARTLLAIEAKADESFGSSTAGDYLSARVDTAGSGVPARVRMLARALFGEAALVDAGLRQDVAALRYQLLTALGGMLIEARRRWAEQAVFVVHEFTSSDSADRAYRGTRAAALAANQDALRALVTSLGGTYEAGALSGPFMSPGFSLVPGGLPFFVGKATVHVEVT